VVLLTPFLLLAGVAITSATQVRQILQWMTANGYVGGAATVALRLTPIVINALGIGILYAVMPNRRAVWRPIAISALIVGCAWQLVAWGYLRLQIGVAGYSAVYGALAQLPVTLVWLYLSWTIVLAGAEIAAVLEFGRAAPAGAGTSPDPRAVALHLLADEFARGGPGIEPRAAAHELGVEIDAVQRATAALQDFGWLAAVDVQPARFVLARAPATIELGRLDGLARRDWVPPRIDPRAAAALREVDAKSPELWAARTLADVL
jgi:membrane protein